MDNHWKTMVHGEWFNTGISNGIYPLVNIQKPMENHRCSWENQLFLWPCQEAKQEVPTIYKADVFGLCKGIYPQNMAKKNGTVPPFQDPGIPIE